MGEVFYTGPESGLAVSWYLGPRRTDGLARTKVQLHKADGQLLQLDLLEWGDLADCVRQVDGELLGKLPTGLGWPRQADTGATSGTMGATDG